MFFLLPWTHKNSNQKYFSSLTKINKSRNILNTSQFCVFYFSREFFWWKNERRSKKYLTNENWLLIFISRATHCVLIEIRRKMRKREMWILSFFSSSFVSRKEVNYFNDFKMNEYAPSLWSIWDLLSWNQSRFLVYNLVLKYTRNDDSFWVRKEVH